MITPDLPDSSEVSVLEQAIAAAKAGNRPLARLHLEKAIASEPDNADIWLWLAWTADSPAGALSALEEAQRNDPEHRLIPAGLAWARAMHEFERNGGEPRDSQGTDLDGDNVWLTESLVEVAVPLDEDRHPSSVDSFPQESMPVAPFETPEPAAPMAEGTSEFPFEVACHDSPSEEQHTAIAPTFPDQEPADQEPSDQESWGQEPADQESSDQEPWGQESSDQESSDQEPSDQEPWGPEPADQEPAPENQGQESEPPLADDPTDSPPQRPTVLAVDDSPTIRKLVSMTLTRHGYDVQTAPDGVSALEQIAASPPQLILMDIKMPRLDGYQLCKLVKKHAKTQMIPVIMLSGKDGMFDKMRGKMVGCDTYITKPFESAELIRKVSQYIPLAVGAE